MEEVEESCRDPTLWHAHIGWVKGGVRVYVDKLVPFPFIFPWGRP